MRISRRCVFILCLALPAVIASGQENGLYAVVREGIMRSGEPNRGRNFTLVYDQKYSEADKDEPAKYVTLDGSFFVPLAFAESPKTAMDANGRPMLNGTLAPEHVKTLEDFTRAHIGDRVAIVIDQQVITMHKVRAVIKGGHVQITRCNDNACEKLRMKLTK